MQTRQQGIEISSYMMGEILEDYNVTFVDPIPNAMDKKVTDGSAIEYEEKIKRH